MLILFKFTIFGQNSQLSYSEKWANLKKQELISDKCFHKMISQTCACPVSNDLTITLTFQWLHCIAGQADGVI